MRSGETRRELARRPGLWTTWGQSLDVAIGDQPQAHELLRATLGRPVCWTVGLWVLGGAAGDVVVVDVAAGLGATVGKGRVLFTLTGQAGGELLQLPVGAGLPAVELIVSVGTLAPAVGAMRIVAQCAPIAWPPDVNPNALEPAW